MARKAKPATNNFLNEAISDVKKELKKLGTTRKKLTSKLSASTKALLSTKATEDRLRDRLSLLIAREGKIREAQSNIRGALAKLKSRTTRVKKIKDDLSESD
jgi:septal ring factor EnvC (AmiA/AmiB activator)